MSTFSGDIGPEGEDGGGWEGLLPDKEERRAARLAKAAAVRPATPEGTKIPASCGCRCTACVFFGTEYSDGATHCGIEPECRYYQKETSNKIPTGGEFAESEQNKATQNREGSVNYTPPLRNEPVGASPIDAAAKVDDEFVAAVEDELGMGHGAWDMEDPEDICKAVLKVAAAVRPATPEVKAQQVVTVAGVSLSVDRYNELLAKSGIYCPYDGKLLTFNGYPTVIQDSPHTTICWGLTCSGCTSTFMLVPHWDAVNKRRMVDPESIKFVAALAVPDAAARLAEKIIDTYKQSTFDNSVENVAALIREAQGEMPAEPSVQPAGSAPTERERFEKWARRCCRAAASLGARAQGEAMTDQVREQWEKHRKKCKRNGYFSDEASFTAGWQASRNAALVEAVEVVRKYAEQNPGQHTLRVCNQIAEAILALKEPARKEGTGGL